MIIRLAKPDDMPTVHMMAHDTWGEGLPPDQHVERCLASPKYKKGRWFVLEHDSELTSALICYRNAFALPENVVGIGSVATAPRHRKKGYAAILLSEVIGKYDDGKPLAGFFLYSDIDPAVYAKHGFVILPKEFQSYEASIAMMRPAEKSQQLILDEYFKAPDYF